MRLGIGTARRRGLASISLRSSLSAPYREVASEADVLNWIATTNGGASAAKPAWPGIAATAGNGLGLLLDLAKLGVEGADFSRNPALAAPTAGTAHPQYTATTKRIVMASTTTAPNRVVSNYDLAGYIDITLTNGTTVLVEDTLIDASIATIFYGVQQQTETSVLVMRRSRVKNAVSADVILRNGTIADCYLLESQADAVTLAGAGPKLLLRNMVRRLGTNPLAHADCVQTAGITSDVITFGNMFYMPHTGGPFDEGTFGTTDVLNYNNAATGATLENFLAVNDALIGGGYTVNIGPDPDSLVNGMALVGCWFSKPGGGYAQYGNFYPLTEPTTGIGRNILVHNCRHIEDGSPVTKNGANAQGLWEYDKATAPARFRQVCRILGYLDANDDPVVTVRHGFHPGVTV